LPGSVGATDRREKDHGMPGATVALQRDRPGKAGLWMAGAVMVVPRMARGGTDGLRMARGGMLGLRMAVAAMLGLRMAVAAMLGLRMAVGGMAGLRMVRGATAGAERRNPTRGGGEDGQVGGRRIWNGGLSSCYVKWMNCAGN
jgi:hypothetical protein